jgi:hypothetical protein
MKPKSKNVNKKLYHNTDSVSMMSFSQNRTKNSGFLKRFLDWIASGADKSNISGTSCPS